MIVCSAWLSVASKLHFHGPDGKQNPTHVNEGIIYRGMSKVKWTSKRDGEPRNYQEWEATTFMFEKARGGNSINKVQWNLEPWSRAIWQEI